MDRREFLTLTARLSAAAALPAALVGCGGGGGGSSQGGETNTNSSDATVSSINSQQSDIDNTNGAVNAQLNNDLNESNNANTNSLIRNTSDADKMAKFFATRNPGVVLTESANAVYAQGHYLDVTNQLSGAQFWQKAISSHEQAYLDYEHQTMKLKAALRLFGAANDSVSDSSSASASSATRTVSMANTKAASTGLASALSSLLEFAGEGLVSSLTSSTVVDGVVAVLNEIKDYLATDSFGASVLSEVFSVVSQFLDDVQEDALNDLSFSNQNQVLLSLSKISVASAAVLANQEIQNLDAADAEGEEEENGFVEAQLFSTDVLNKLSLKWLALAKSVLEGAVSDATTSIDGAAADENYAGDTSAQDRLFSSSAILAMTSLAIKNVSGNFDNQLSGLTSSQTSFESNSSASSYRPVFTSPSNSFDDELQANVPGLDASTSSTYQSELNIASVSSATISSNAPAADDQASDEIYQYASEIAAVNTDIASPVDFASQLAEYAYNFASDAESDAFEFAMQGMEYGYLFASQGEDVGVMADRILWMAVQIGVMADRIGEMADRIVYTEHLIVYTEMLIVDFGIMIYGVIKQITNSMLMALALILDREWYGDVATEQANAEDQVLSTIGANIGTMLNNMNAYSLAVLDNQQALRESTLSVLNEDGEISFADNV